MSEDPNRWLTDHGQPIPITRPKLEWNPPPPVLANDDDPLRPRLVKRPYEQADRRRPENARLRDLMEWKRRINNALLLERLERGY